MYLPTGDSPNDEWHTVDGNSLVNIIQTGEGYKYKPKGITPRPFWNNFIDEQANGEFMKNFAKGMSPFELNYSVSDLVLDGSEKDTDTIKYI